MVDASGWMHKAACRDADPQLFFPDSWNASTMRPVRRICDACPVTQQCLMWAIRNNLATGVYGGMTPGQRRSYRRTSNLAADPVYRHSGGCGTAGGYRRHLRNGERSCDDCLAAERTRTRNNQQRAALERAGRGNGDRS